MSHFLIKNAFKYDSSLKKNPLKNNFIYDDISGYWREKSSQKPLMHMESGFKPQTKKADVETGEDRKGE